jgi:hypothetical protein
LDPKAIKSFGDHAGNFDWAAVYYAGHGIEIGGTSASCLPQTKRAGTPWR